MGYTHYWYREKTIDPESYKAIVDDFRKIIPVLGREGVKLAGADGTGDPEIDYDGVYFNGVRNCGHSVNSEICIAWASPNAQGVGSSRQGRCGRDIKGSSKCTTGLTRNGR